MNPRHARLPLVLCVGLALAALAPAVCRGEPDAEQIAWVEGLPAAFERAAVEKKVVMVCINARNAIGEREEPAAKGLREIVYRDPAVVARSREFVCVLLTAEGTSEDYGELRYRFGIDGSIVSPQHVFARPDHRSGARPLVREEYWSYGSGEQAVRALLDLMDEALEAYEKQKQLPAPPPPAKEGDGAGGTVPASTAEREAWVQELVELVRGRDKVLRIKALRALVTHDHAGDCVRPVMALVEELAEDDRTRALVDVVRTLGVPGLEAAAPVLHDLLKHKDIHVRANVAVTLEYIGSEASTKPLLACAKREKDEGLANHLWRALGRCGAGDKAAKRGLLRCAKVGKEGDFGCYGAVIGLAYREGDAKLARELEKRLLKLGPPFEEASDPHGFLRVLVIWCLGEVRDPQSAAFVRDHVVAPLEDGAFARKADFVAFCEAVARRCEGADDTAAAIDAAMADYRETDVARALADRARRGRDMRAFVPKGEWGIVPRPDDE